MFDPDKKILHCLVDGVPHKVVRFWKRDGGCPLAGDLDRYPYAAEFFHPGDITIVTSFCVDGNSDYGGAGSYQLVNVPDVVDWDKPICHERDPENELGLEYVGPLKNPSAKGCTRVIYRRSDDFLLMRREDGTAADGSRAVINMPEKPRTIQRAVACRQGLATVATKSPDGKLIAINGCADREPFWTKAGWQIGPFSEFPVKD
jgi:hypothetical protein